jgi:hypothetical protein
MLRNPLIRILNHIQYDNKIDKRLSWFDRAKLVSTHQPKDKHYMKWDCYYDNYYTRVFSSHCQAPRKIDATDFAIASYTLLKFDICFVTEWFENMRPLIEMLSKRMKKSFTYNQQLTDQLRGYKQSVSIYDDFKANNDNDKVDPDNFFNASEKDLLLLANIWDVKLYHQCQRSASFLLKHWVHDK